MKSLLIFLFILLASLAFLQDNKLFAIEGTIGWSSRLLYDNGSVSSNVQYIYSDTEKGVLAYDIGGVATFQLSETLEIQTGLKFWFSAKSCESDIKKMKSQVIT